MAADEVNSKRQIRKTAELAQIIAKDECKLRFKKVAAALKKEPSERTVAENELLSYSDDVIKEIQKRAQNREKLKTRQLEIEDPEEVLHWKCRQLAAAIKQSKCLVVYTGAGISTAASIPDYRGPNGVWTLLQQGKQVKTQDLSDAEPTSTHMALTTLYNVKLVKHVVSQNCDGLHLRSGLPRKALSEVHGNMYIERCTECQAEYIRLFDVTEKTGIRRHKTDRKCIKCKGALKDTIIHFGEKAPLDGIYNWLAARKMVDKADMILCLGSSLKVLRKYACLWSMHQPLHKRPKLYIVNLQWTPKDEIAMLKINGKCDEVLTRIMDYLGFNLPPYKSFTIDSMNLIKPFSNNNVLKRFLENIDRENDPIFQLCTHLRIRERKTTTRKILPSPEIKIELRGNKKHKLMQMVQDISTKDHQASDQENSKRVPVNAEELLQEIKTDEDSYQTMKWMLNQTLFNHPLIYIINKQISTAKKLHDSQEVCELVGIPEMIVNDHSYARKSPAQSTDLAAYSMSATPSMNSLNGFSDMSTGTPVCPVRISNPLCPPVKLASMLSAVDQVAKSQECFLNPNPVIVPLHMNEPPFSLSPIFTVQLSPGLLDYPQLAPNNISGISFIPNLNQISGKNSINSSTCSVTGSIHSTSSSSDHLATGKVLTRQQDTCSLETVVDSLSESDLFESNISSLPEKKETTQPEKIVTGNISSSFMSAPGWFGKGFNPRRSRKRKL